MESTYLPSRPKCPTCRADLSAATDPSGAGNVPTPGDVTVCSYCTDVLIYTTDMQLRIMSAAEQKMLGSTQLELIEGYRAFVARRGKNKA
jgi:hypothetical protein